MEYRKLGASGLKVSPLCLGTMMFGDRTDYATAERIVRSAAEAGVNFVDTADQYAKGESERMTGKLLSGKRDNWVLATKVGNALGKRANQGGLGRRWIMEACAASLKRLDTDYIDIYYLHFDDEQTPLEETLRAMGDLIGQGKVRYLGLSNFRAWRVAEVIRVCASLGLARPVVLQPYYNAMNRMPESELLPACQYYGLGVVPYSPLARGVLTGKYKPGQEPPEDSRAGRNDTRMMQTEFRTESIAMAQQIKEHAGKRGMSAGQFALNWVLNNELVHSVIAGPRTYEQWTDYLAALDHRLDDEDEALLDTLVSPGHPSTPGYSDPRYPFVGRIVRHKAP